MEPSGLAFGKPKGELRGMPERRPLHYGAPSAGLPEIGTFYAQVG
jgi:hypothetical protein